eukprot:RCo040901
MPWFAALLLVVLLMLYALVGLMFLQIGLRETDPHPTPLASPLGCLQGLPFCGEVSEVGLDHARLWVPPVGFSAGLWRGHGLRMGVVVPKGGRAMAALTLLSWAMQYLVVGFAGLLVYVVAAELLLGDRVSLWE